MTRFVWSSWCSPRRGRVRTDPAAPTRRVSAAEPSAAGGRPAVCRRRRSLHRQGPCCRNYTEIYERLFFPWKEEPIKIFEIGVAEGGSLKMWHAYFPQARIFGVDFDPKTQFDNERVKTLSPIKPIAISCRPPSTSRAATSTR